MTLEEWEIFGQFVKDVIDRFDEQENRMKHHLERIKKLEEQIELLTEDEEWILVQTKDLRNS